MDKSNILGSIDIGAKLIGSRAKVMITQTFTNHGKRKIEASYTFPVPPKAMVQEFILTLGEKEVKSSIEETEKAYDAYDKAIQKGDTAGIIESVRKDILELSLGNIAPGEVAKITLTYLQEIPLTDNKSKILLRIPLVVAPRYENNPTQENLRIQPIIGESQTVIRLKVDIEEFSSIEKLSSPSHPIQTSIQGKNATVLLALENEKADSDFVLDITLAEDSNSFSHTDDSFTLIQVNPILETKDKEVKQISHTFAFLLDHSGSMEGSKLIQAKQALKLCLRQLNMGDEFAIVAFDDRFIHFSETPLPYTDESMQRADAWIDSLSADGGTEILAPLEYLFKILGKVENGVVLIFTDGQVSNEDQIIRLVENNQEKVTVHPFGIDTAVNESFINGIAEAGNGVSEFIYPGERMEDKVLRHFDRILSPCWENVKLYEASGEELEVVPTIPSKLFLRDTYSFLHKQESGAISLPITLHATIQGKVVSHQLKEVKIMDNSLSSWWAITKIRVLEKDLNMTNPRRQGKIKKEIIGLSKEYQVLSTLTSLVAIFPRTIKAKGMPEYVKIPVCAPRQWVTKYRKMAGMKFSGGFPEAEPLMANMSSAGAQFDMGITVRENVSPLPLNSTNDKPKTREDKFRELVLKQKVNGSISIDGQESLQATALFILILLQDRDANQTYRKSIQKAIQYLLSKPSQGKEEFFLLQVCAFQSALKAKLGEEQLLSKKITNYTSALSASEKKIFDYFCQDNQTPLWRKLDNKITGSDTWEEISEILIKSLNQF